MDLPENHSSSSIEASVYVTGNCDCNADSESAELNSTNNDGAQSAKSNNDANHNADSESAELNNTNSDGAQSVKSSKDALAKGLGSTLASFITDFDSKAHNTLSSQHDLSLAIDRLTGELDQLLEDAPLPFIMQHAAKITKVRKRVSSLNSVLRTIQRRIDNVDRILTSKIHREKKASDCPPEHQ